MACRTCGRYFHSTHNVTHVAIAYWRALAMYFSLSRCTSLHTTFDRVVSKCWQVLFSCVCVRLVLFSLLRWAPGYLTASSPFECWTSANVSLIIKLVCWCPLNWLTFSLSNHDCRSRETLDCSEIKHCACMPETFTGNFASIFSLDHLSVALIVLYVSLCALARSHTHHIFKLIVYILVKPSSFGTHVE